MSAMLREAGLLKELAEANERIRQLEAQSVPVAVVVDADARRCRECTAPRKGDTCWKCGGPTFKPHHSWVEAELPDVARIRALAKEVGYAIGEHGSRERDFDLIAVPWAEGAVGFDELVKHIAVGINAYEVGDRESKPHGRVGVNLQIDGYYKRIDLSVMPLFIPAAELASLREKGAQLDRERRANDKMSNDHRVLMAKIGERDDRIHQLEQERDELRKALLALKEDCQTSNDCQYGTLSTSHVARIVDAAIAQEQEK